MKKINRGILLLLLCLGEVTAVCVTGVLDTFAEEAYTAADGNQIDDTDLEDGVIEYRELGSLVHRYNNSVSQARDSLQRTKDDYAEIKDRLVWNRADAVSDKKEAKDEKDMETYATDSANEKIYTKSIESYNKMIEKLNTGKTYNSSWKSLEKTFTKAAQSLMFSYQSLALEEESLQESKNLYEQLYADAVTKQQAGIGTEAEAMEAENRLTGIANSLESITDGKASVYSSLCLLLGLDQDRTYEIQSIPEFDEQKIAAISLSDNLNSAINNNTTIMSTRHTSANTTADSQDKALKESGQTEELKIKMNELYNDTEKAELAWQTASTGYAAAERSFSSARIKYEAGLSGKSEYLQAELAYTRKKSSLESANLSMAQAYETYEWAVRGQTELE